MPSAVITSDTDAETFAAALEPELRRDLPRTEASVSVSGDTLTVKIEAEDTVSLRAAVNSVLECMSVVQRMNNITKGTQ